MMKKYELGKDVFVSLKVGEQPLYYDNLPLLSIKGGVEMDFRTEDHQLIDVVMTVEQARAIYKLLKKQCKKVRNNNGSKS